MYLMDPKSFSGQIVLKIVDKLVIGLVAALVVFSFQKCQANLQAERDAKLAVADIHNDLTIAEIESLHEHFIQFVQTAHAAVNAGTVLQEDLRLLNRKLLLIDIQIGHLRESLDSRLTDADTLIQSLGDFQDSLVGAPEGKLTNGLRSSLESALVDIRNEYRTLASEIRKGMTKKVQESFESVEK